MRKNRRFTRKRNGSALLTVIIFSTIIAIATTALVSFGIQRRRETARLVLYNAELSTSENILETLVSRIEFLGRNRPSQVLLTDAGLAGFITDQLTTDIAGTHPGFEVDARVVTLADRVTEVVTADTVDLLGADFEQWLGYTISYSTFRIYAGARANGDSGMAFSEQLRRPGVYLSKSVTIWNLPLLNYAIFYDNNLEIDAGVQIDVYGKVHTNQNWYLTTSSRANYHDYCTVAGNFFGGIYHPGDAARRTWSGGDGNIYITDHSPGSPGGAADAYLNKIRNSGISINRPSGVSEGYLSSYNYNGAPGDPRSWTVNPNWVDKSQEMFDGFLKDKAHGIKQVGLPIAETESPYLVVEQPDLAAGGEDVGRLDKISVNLGYQASIIFEAGPNWPITDPNDIVAYRLIEDPDEPTGFAKSAAFSTRYKLAGDAAAAAPRTFLSTKKTYNGRERKYAYQIDVDMGKLAEYLDSTSTNPDSATKPKFDLNNPRTDIDDGIIYVIPRQDASWQGAARISNAADLSGVMSNSGMDSASGLTFASCAPVYTFGSINHTGGTATWSTSPDRIPLLIAGDAICPLSGKSGFDAAYDGVGETLSGNGPNRDGDPFFQNAVFIGGNVPTPDKYIWDPAANSGAGGWITNPSHTSQYSGGAENFFRYLENLGSDDPHYFRGSILNLYKSRIATHWWDNDPGSGADSGYYGAPRRYWSWDSRFANGVTPPGMPEAFEVRPTRWTLVNKDEFIDNGGTDLSLS